MLNDFGIFEKFDLIKQWYNGYCAGDPQSKYHVGIYNPWSILNCIKGGGDFRCHWLETAGKNILVSELIQKAPQSFFI